MLLVFDEGSGMFRIQTGLRGSSRAGGRFRVLRSGLGLCGFGAGHPVRTPARVGLVAAHIVLRRVQIRDRWMLRFMGSGVLSDRY